MADAARFPEASAVLALAAAHMNHSIPGRAELLADSHLSSRIGTGSGSGSGDSVGDSSGSFCSSGSGSGSDKGSGNPGRSCNGRTDSQDRVKGERAADNTVHTTSARDVRSCILGVVDGGQKGHQYKSPRAFSTEKQHGANPFTVAVAAAVVLCPKKTEDVITPVNDSTTISNNSINVMEGSPRKSTGGTVVTTEAHTSSSSTHAIDNSSSSFEAWPEPLHRSFAAAVFDIGLSHSSPSVIADRMQLRPKHLTSERLKSHLQKFRQAKEKERLKFLEDYDVFSRTLKRVGPHMLLDSSALHSILQTNSRKAAKNRLFLGGQMPAYLSHRIIAEAKLARRNRKIASHPVLRQSHGRMPSQIPTVVTIGGERCAAVPFPSLSAAEKQTHVGISLQFVKGLIQNMGSFILQNRNQPVTPHQTQAVTLTIPAAAAALPPPPPPPMLLGQTSAPAAQGMHNLQHHHYQQLESPTALQMDAPRASTTSPYTNIEPVNPPPGRAIPPSFEFNPPRASFQNNSKPAYYCSDTTTNTNAGAGAGTGTGSGTQQKTQGELNNFQTISQQQQQQPDEHEQQDYMQTDSTRARPRASSDDLHSLSSFPQAPQMLDAKDYRHTSHESNNNNDPTDQSNRDLSPLMFRDMLLPYDDEVQLSPALSDDDET